MSAATIPAATGYIGASLRRREDPQLLRGEGRYADDLPFPGAAYVVFARSPYAHARIRGIDTAAAAAAPGVLTVLTGQDLADAGVGTLPHAIGSSTFGSDVPLANDDGSERARTPHRPLPIDKVRFAGEAYAAVIADTRAQAMDAAELIEADFEELRPVTDALQALAEDAPTIWDNVPGNMTLDAQIGVPDATDRAFARAAHVVRFKSHVTRVTGVHMEPRTAVADYDTASGRWTMHCSSGAGIVTIQSNLAAALGVETDRVRVISPENVGGGFGTRNGAYPEWAVMALAAQRTGRPVKHVVDRMEAFLSDYQARDLHVDAELALDADGRFLGLRSVNTSNIGAHTVSYVALNKGVQLMTGLYRVPAAASRARAVLTNTPPTVPYRSAGRPEAMFAIERLVDLAARQCGFDRADLRRRNMIPDDAFPYANPYGVTYDNGAHIAALNRVLELADYDTFEARRQASAAKGMCRGFGFANYIEGPGGNPRERAVVTVRPGPGKIEVLLGTSDSGQGHRTAFSQLVASFLGIAPDDVEMKLNDTDVVTVGGGSHSGRSLRFGSIVMGNAGKAMLLRARAVLAAARGVPVDEVAYDGGMLRLSGTNETMSLFEVARIAETDGDLAAELQGPLAGESDEITRGLAFPYGAAACELEIDPETGALQILRYVSVDDVGRALNPMIVHGQTHGGIVQGVGQALFEKCSFDPRTGNLLSATFMDYTMPRAADFPMFTTEISEVPATSHPMGFRPGGEGGTTPALAVVINGVTDALAHLGVTHVDMPATPARIWQAIQDARAGRA